MSKWGVEEIETLTAIETVGFKGNILNIAAGDGRFNTKLLELADTVTAIDISDSELESLKKNCPSKLKNKLSTEKVDITKKFPFKDESFDGVFCTGTLHLFKKEQLELILNEFTRVLRENGKIVLDFATDIKRLDDENHIVIFDQEEPYTLSVAEEFFKSNLKNFTTKIIVSTFKEENLDYKTTGYSTITGKFLVICGHKNRKSD